MEVVHTYGIHRRLLDRSSVFTLVRRRNQFLPESVRVRRQIHLEKMKKLSESYIRRLFDDSGVLVFTCL